jgi:YbbR domain-containing protein
MSEISDALCVVVSEETGTISVAQDGQMERGLDRTGLHQRLTEFYTRAAETKPVTQWQPWKNWHFRLPPLRRALANLGFLFLSLILALIATMAVRQQNDPFTTTTMTAVPLNVINKAPDVALTTSPPRTVSVDFQSTASDLSGLGPNSFQATVDLSEVTDGANRLPVTVDTTADRVLIIGPKPAQVDVAVASIITRTMPVTVRIEDTDELSAAYEVRGDPLSVPDTVEVTGPSPDVDRIAAVQAPISVAGATSTVEDSRPLVALDELGEEVMDIDIIPEEVDVTIIVRRRIDARDVGVRAVTTGSPPETYWLRGLSVNPSSVTLQGNPNTIAELGGFVDTLPVDLSGAVDVKTEEVPLDLPSDVQALGSDGSVVGTVRVTAVVEPLSGDLLVERPVELINDRGTLTVTLEPPQVTLLLSGPLPTLNEIEVDPSLVHVVIDALTLEPNMSVEVIPDIIAPEGIRTQSIESSVLVTAVP